MRKNRLQRMGCLLLLLSLAPYSGQAQRQAVIASVSRVGAGYREEKGGWACLHLKGTPKEIGRQYGQMAAPEIDEANRALRLFLKNDSGKEWDFYREAA